MPDSSIPTQSVAQLIDAVKSLSIATLTAAIVGNMNRSVSMEDITAISTHLYFALHPAPGSGRYEAWAKTRDDKKPWE